MASKKSEMEKINDQIDILNNRQKKVAQFDDLLSSLEGVDDKKKLLWSEIYNNALADRESAAILFTDTFIQLKGNAANHSILGPVVVKYIERMSRANDQLIKLAEIITSEESRPVDSDSIFSQINEGE